MTPFTLVAADFVLTGGMDRANLALASHLHRRGHPLHLVTHRCDPALAAAPGVTVHRVPRPLRSNGLGEPLLGMEGLRVHARVGGRLVANGGNCPASDINWVHYVHAAFGSPPSGTLAQRARRRAFRQYFRLTERVALRRAGLVIANSERTRRDLVELLQVPAERCHTVYCGIDGDVFRVPSAAERAEVRRELGTGEGRFVFGFVGGLGDRRKGFATLFEAFQLLRERDACDAELWVMGSGAELKIWRERVSAEGLEGRVKMLGFREDVPRLLRGCDAFVAPTLYEPYGLAIAEAICTGLPIVCSSWAGIAERFPAELRMLLVDEPQSARELGDRMEECAVRGAALRPAVSVFGAMLRADSWERMAERMTALFEAGTGVGDQRAMEGNR